MKRKLYTECLVLCCVLSLAAASSAFAIQSGEEENINALSTSNHYKLKIHGKKLDYKYSGPFSGSNSVNYQGKAGSYAHGSILVPRAIRVTDGGSPVIIFQAGNEIIYYHNYFKIVMKN